MKVIKSLAVTLVLGGWLFLAQPVGADNCGSLSDCYNTLRAAIAAGVGVGVLAMLISLGLDLTPVVGTLKGLLEAMAGKDLITGIELEWWERALGVVPFAGAGIDVFKYINKVDEAGELIKLLTKYEGTAEELLSQYGDDGIDILHAYDNIANIPGAEQLLKDVLSGGTTAKGALSEIGYINSLKKQGVVIEKVADKIGNRKAADILIKDGPVIDVKDYDWGHNFYKDIPKVQKSLTKQVQLYQDRYPGRPIRYAFTDLEKMPPEVLKTLQDLGVEVTKVTWAGK